jgi:fumarate reductase subunit C
MQRLSFCRETTGIALLVYSLYIIIILFALSEEEKKIMAKFILMHNAYALIFRYNFNLIIPS